MKKKIIILCVVAVAAVILGYTLTILFSAGV